MSKETYGLSDCLKGGPGLDGYTFSADVYCETCAEKIAREVFKDGRRVDWVTFCDSEEVPQPNERLSALGFIESESTGAKCECGVCDWTARWEWRDEDGEWYGYCDHHADEWGRTLERKRLEAAAPDLLAALKAIHEWLFVDQLEAPKGDGQLADQIRAAIAKAEGRTG